MNEPHRGYIDLPSLHKFDYNTDLHLSSVRAYYFRHSTLSVLIRSQHLLSSLLCSHLAIRLRLDTGLVRSPSQVVAPRIVS